MESSNENSAGGANRTALYTRYSSDMQSPLACDDQERECRERARRDKFDLRIVDRDAAVRAGAMAGREGYARIMAAIENDEIDILLVFELSRFSRDLFAGVAELAKLRRHGVKIAEARGTGLIDLSDSVGQMRVVFGLITSEKETTTLGQRSKYGLRGKVENGYSGGGQPPYGYKRLPEYSDSVKDIDGNFKRIGVRFVPSEEQAPIVRRIFEHYADGITKGGIARKLNEQGVPTKRSGDLRSGRRNSGAWDASKVRFILMNRIYTGERIWNRHSRLGEKLPSSGKKRLQRNPDDKLIRVQGSVEPLIDKDLWQRVQDRLQADAAEYKANHTAGFGRKHLLSGHLRCTDCGSAMVLAGYRNGVAGYRCNLNRRGGGGCGNGQFVPAEALERAFKTSLDVAVKDPKKLAALVDEHNHRVDDANREQLAVIRDHEDRLRDAEGRRDRLVKVIETDENNELKSVVVRLREVEKEVSSFQQRLAEASRAIRPRLVPRSGAMAEYAKGEASIFTGEVEKDRATIERLIHTMTVSGTGYVAVCFRADGLFGPLLQQRLDFRPAGGASANLALARRHARESLGHARKLARFLRHDAKDIVLHANTRDGEYWVHTGGHDPVLDDNDDLGLAGEGGENSVGDPNGIRTRVHGLKGHCPGPD